MKPIDAHIALRSALAKGFREASTSQGQKKRSDHYYLFYYDQQNRKTSWRIKVSHGAREIKAGHIRSDAMRCRLKPEDMLKILNCEHDRQWVELHYGEQQQQQHPPFRNSR